MGMSTTYGPSNDEESLATLRRAIELGITSTQQMSRTDRCGQSTVPDQFAHRRNCVLGVGSLISQPAG